MEEKINKQDVFCAICGSLKNSNSKFCKQCQKDTSNLYRENRVEGKEIRALSLKTKQKRQGRKGVLNKSFSGYKPSGDPKFPEGVNIDMTVDVENNKYDQVVKNNVTGEIIHEEHLPLDQHGSKSYKK